MADYGQLRAEIDADPGGLGYAGKTDAEVSVLLNTANRPSGAFTVNSSVIYEAIKDAEAEALTGARDKARLAEIYSISGPIALGTGSRVQTVLESLFADGSASKAALLALQPPDITRAQGIGLGPGRTRESDVFKARAL